LTASQEKLDESKPRGVHFAVDDEPKKLSKEPSRDSDEVALITELPWHKKHEYRTVTPFLKPNKKKTISNENVSVDFRPIETSQSTENLNLEILKPVPIFASKSFQELPTSGDFKPFDYFQTKSSDDLLSSNIDGVRKPESKRHKLMRIRSTSINSLNRLSDQLVYQNFDYEVPMSADVVMRRKKPPLPLPRMTDSKTIVYVLDKEKDEFVLEKSTDEAYEEVLLCNEVDRNSDSSLFKSLVDSRDDCK
jgi:hypothetical protein